MGEEKTKEICPDCVAEGDSSKKKFEIKEDKDKIIKEYSCGHKVIIEDKILNEALMKSKDVQLKQIKEFLKQE